MGHPLAWCYQCGKCSAGCPAAFAMSEPPNRIVRLLQLGLPDRALSQNSYWLCSSCETCTTRCPRTVQVKEIMEVLRHEAFRRGIAAGQRDVPAFHRAFLKTVALFGRIYEPGLILLNNLLSGKLTRDVTSAPGMFFKGKIKLFPAGGADRRALARIFAAAAKGADVDDV